MSEPAAPAPVASAARRTRPERPWQRCRRAVLAACARATIGVVGRLPFGMAGWLGARVGGLGYWLNRRESRRAVAHLARAFPAESPAWHRRTARRMFRHVGRIGAEFIRAIRWPPAERRRRLLLNADEWLPVVTADATEGRGALTLTAHFGSWELMGSMAVDRLPLTVVARRPNDPRLARLADALRERAGVQVVYQDASPRPLLRALRNHELVGILADQDVRRLPGIFVPFFGTDAHTITSPIEIARAAGATLRIYVCARVPGGYKILWSDRIDPGPKGDDAALRRATLAWTEWLEARIREQPWQWMWMHRRWKTRPEDVAADAARAPVAP